MDQNRLHIQEDLRGLIAGEVHCGDVFLQLYASDASIYQITPVGVVLPRNTADVVACVKYAQENQIPIHARGSGTGLAGESLGPGLVIDFSKHLRRIVQAGEDRVRIQPGIVHERLNSFLGKRGRQFGPDPATSGVTTMGGQISVDGGGSHWLKYGSVRRHVISLQVVLADGTVLELGREKVSADGRGIRSAHDTSEINGDTAEPRRRRLVNRVAGLLERHQPKIEANQPKSLVNRCGYQVADVLFDGHVDMAKLLCGSEGTLALITEATLATQPLPKHRAVAMLFFDQLEKAARAAQVLVAQSAPSACDLMDRRHLSLARETDARYRPIIPAAAEAMLLIEQEGDELADVRDRLQLAVDHAIRKKRLAFESSQAYDAEQIALYWNLALKVVPTLYRLRGSSRPLPFVEDIAVPPAALPGFLTTVQDVLKRHQVTASTFCHAGHGQLHLRPFLDLSRAADVEKIHHLASDLYEAVFEVQGSISGEHGDGLSRTSFVARQYGELYPLFGQIKRTFDPIGVFNPGKKVADALRLETRNLRPVSPAALGQGTRDEGQGTDGERAGKGEAGAPPELVQLQLNWSLEEMAHVARSCNGCGACRSQSSEVRMCPIFRFGPAEESSPRAKANLMRGLLTGRLNADAIASDEFKAVADLCVNCQMCRLECPANVDIPKLMIEAKAAHVRAKGLPFGDLVLTRLDLVSGICSRISPLVNWALCNRSMRWLIEKTLGIAQGRKLPRFVHRTFLRWADKRRLTRPLRTSGRKVAFFVDDYVNHHDPKLGEALVHVMEHNGATVYVPPVQHSSGMTAIALGSLERAKKIAVGNVASLADAVRQGYTIVTTEPSAAMCLTREYPMLLNDDDSRLVAEHSNEACAYLWEMHRGGDLQLDFKPLNGSLLYHMPCHLKALQVGAPGCNLLRLVPGLSVHRAEEGCSGMAGTFGLKKENYRSSLRAGWGVISNLRQTALQAGTTECSACKMQMEQGTTKPTIHPLKLLALSYGLMPELSALLNTQGQELVVT